MSTVRMPRSSAFVQTLLLVFSVAATAFSGWAMNSRPRLVDAAVSATSSAGECTTLEVALGDNADLLTDKQQGLVASLLQLKQDHLFTDWPKKGTDDENKVSLVEQLEALDASYPGGLGTYITKARDLLASAGAGDNPFEGYTPSVPSGEDLVFGDDEYVSMEKMGIEAAARSAFVLVAGGLGERLGYSGIKVALPVDLLTEKRFLHMYADWILGLQSRCRKATGKASLELPLVIMTSGDTDAPTRALLEAEGYFGLSPSQVHVVMQDKVPALSDASARLTVKKGDRWSLETKPHGHGDVHHLLFRSGLATEWKVNGVEWAFFFQDTNPLVTHALVPMLGVSVDRRYDMNSLCVPRKAGEAAGAITRLEHLDGHSLTINVEYNQLDPLLRATPGYENGDVNDPETDFSPFPGNVNNLLVYVPTYERVVSGPDQGVVEEFVNPKYKDDTRTTFKKPTRLECMMQDLPKLLAKELGNAANVGFTTMERWLTFSPAKNDPESGAASSKKGSPPGTPGSAEADVYRAHAKILTEVCGVAVEAAEPQTFAGTPVALMPAVVLGPDFAVTSSELRRKIRGGRISPRSTLVVEGEGVELIEDLDLDGALIIRAGPGASVRVTGLKVQNKGWKFVEASEDAPEEIRIRGFQLEKHETKVIEVTDPGRWEVSPDGELKRLGD